MAVKTYYMTIIVFIHLLVVSHTFLLIPYNYKVNVQLKATLQNPGNVESIESQRLQRARLRLAEVQGKVPRGTSELAEVSTLSQSLKSLPISTSRVREISWRVAEPAVKYDPEEAANKLFSQPLRWLKRNVQIFVPLTFFIVKIVTDIIFNKEATNRNRRAEELLTIISQQSPALIKAGQALASRPDLLPKEYLDELQKLQDRCPQFRTEDAFDVFEKELGKTFESVFEFDGAADELKPVAAASIGQVYKARLRSNGCEVAIKIQRPACEDVIAVDLYILRWYSSIIQNIFKSLQRDIDLVSVIDDFGDLIYRELDYRAEAVNAQRFAELYASIPDVFVPKVFTDLSTSKVLTMEWVSGARLNDAKAIEKMGLEGSKFVDILVQCSLKQMLENGFFHADPHAGNLIAMPSGKLCYLDFGMVSYVEASQRYSIIEAVVHLVNRDFAALAELYKRMGFIPGSVDTKPIIAALESALPDVLSAPVGELNFKNVIQKLGDVMYKFPFSLPPFYIAIIRCLGVLEGLAIQVDKDFRIINDAYPYIASRLLTDQSPELQEALRQLLFKENEPRWERLTELLEKASDTSDYDSSLAVDQLILYLSSTQGAVVREIFVKQAIDIIDGIGVESLDYVSSVATKLSIESLGNNFVEKFRGAAPDNIYNFLDMIMQTLSEEANKSSNPSEKLRKASRTLAILQTSGDLQVTSLTALSRKIAKEPVMVNMVSRILSALVERSTSRVVGRIMMVPV